MGEEIWDCLLDSQSKGEEIGRLEINFPGPEEA